MAIRAEFSGEDPIAIFNVWLGEAEASEINDPNAAALATSTKDGVPSVRMVLVKSTDQSGFKFYTNVESRKGRELQTNARAALCFHWKSLRRQVRVAGLVTELPEQDVDTYFHSRSRMSQIGAAVSSQSRPLESRSMLEEQVEQFANAHSEGMIPRPSYWQGYALRATTIEFWIDGANRLHDRRLFTRESDTWTSILLYP